MQRVSTTEINQIKRKTHSHIHEFIHTFLKRIPTFWPSSHFLPSAFHPSFQQERAIVRKRVELAVEANVLVAQFDSPFYIRIAVSVD